MDTLPPEILFYNIYPFLEIDSINLALTCKKFYSIYVELRDSNELIAKRFDRVNKKRAECLNNNKKGIIFDRMYEIYPYHEHEMMLVFVKTWTFDYNNLDNYSVGLRKTNDKWASLSKEDDFKPVNQYDYEDSGLIETTWLAVIHDYYDMWFALYLKYNCDNVEWDNNNGWNYDTLHDHVPCINTIEKYPIVNFWYGSIDNAYSDLNEWLHYWTAEKYAEKYRRLNNIKD